MSSTKQEQADQVAEFLAQGGQVDLIPRGKSGYQEGQSRSAWGAPRKKAAVVAEPIVAKKPRKATKK
jgi:hypothetical protein